jgi:hypothetical protein
MWGRGVVREARATLGTWWLKEMVNFNVKTVAVSFFLYLACVAPAITFGAIYAKLVGGWMGAIETLVATAIAFPLVIAACIPIRIWVLPKLFDRDTLVLLDGDDDEVREMLEKKDLALRCDDDPSVHEAPAEKAAAASEGAGVGEVGVVVKS